MSSSSKSQRGQNNREQLIVLLTFAGVGIVFVVLLLFLASTNAGQVVESGAYSEFPQATSSEGFPMIGKPEAKVMLIEFSNFSCPGCAQYSGDIEKIIQTHVKNGEARLTFAPMIFAGGEHPSFVAAQAALCAGKQGAFWEMHTALFNLHKVRGANVFTLEVVQEAAKNLKLDSDALAVCVTGGEMAPIVQRALDLASQVGLQYTPSLLYSLDGGTTLQWFEKDGTRLDAQVPLDVVAAVIASSR